MNSGMAIGLLMLSAQPEADPLAPLVQAEQPQAAAPTLVAPPVAVPATQVPPAASPLPVPTVQVPRDWREVFLAIRSGHWAAAQAGIVALPPGPLTPVAKAELFTARGSPVVSLGQIEALVREAPELPRAEQLARMAVTRGATTPPGVIARRPTVWLGNAPGRARARPVSGEPAADQLRSALDPLLNADDAAGGEYLLMQSAPLLSAEARAEAGQRVAWVYYRIGRDADARRVADAWRTGASGDWAAHAAWVSGLASWRLGDCESASRAFRQVPSLSGERELSAAAHYWGARAEQACRRPHAVAPMLRAAAASAESFYGLVARETLAMDKRLPLDPLRRNADIRSLPNARRAIELAAIGEARLAEDMLRHQAQIGGTHEHQGLIELARQLDLASAQFWLAHSGQRGAVVDSRDRYPMPRWAPQGGWRIDPALALAHIRQESSFRIDAVSPVGAVGLMQVMPATGSDIARRNGIAYSPARLAEPMLNIELGQSFIERIRGSAATQGQLPKIIAAYNAGSLPVGRWVVNDRGDPLLWIESIPYWETRFYVPSVLRNLWVYQTLAGADTPALTALVQHRWPGFPIAAAGLSR